MKTKNTNQTTLSVVGMQKVSSPIRPKDTGAAVKTLHEALVFLAKKMTIPGLHDLLKDASFLKQWNSEIKAVVYGSATQQAVKLFQQKQMEIKATGIVNEATAAAINKLLDSREKKKTSTPVADNKLKVSGIIYNEWIEPMAGAVVKVFDKDIRSEHLLGESKTDEKGSYTIPYSRSELTRTDKGGADLIVRVYGSRSSEDKPLFISPVYYNAAAQLQVNVNLGPRAYMGTSEFVKTEKLVREFSGNLSIDTLAENKKVQDLTFLINKTGIAVNTLLQLVASFRFEKWTGLEAEVYYGILSATKAFPAAKSGAANLPADVDTSIEQAYINFWNAPLANMMTALQQAATDNTITYTLLKRTKAISAGLQKLKMAPPQEKGSTLSLPPVFTLIKTAGLNTVQQQAFLNLYSASAIGPAFWASLAQDSNFQGSAGTAAVNKLQAVYQLAGWTTNNAALTDYIIRKYAVDSVQGFSSLASNNVNDWVTVINASKSISAASNDAAAMVNYLAASIASGIEQLYPTQVFAARFSKSTTLKIANPDYIAGILNSKDFDILKSSMGAYLPAYIQKNPLPAGTDPQTITYQLMGLQRTYKITQSADSSLTLLAANIQSARQIYAMGKSNFVNQYTTLLGSAATAGAVFERAVQIHAGATHLFGQMISKLSNPAINVMPDYANQLPGSRLLTEYPDLADLFGMGTSYCECTDCESFLGIPAYLADLLNFIYQRKSTNGNNPRTILLANNYYYDPNLKNEHWQWRRRPDIGDIDLNCDNSNVELPYIDIVNELLEDYIIPPLACINVPMAGQTWSYLWNWLGFYMKPGTIDINFYGLLQQIANDAQTPICNIHLLSKNATISEPFFTHVENLPSWGPLVPGTVQLALQWIIRDEYITLKLILVVDAAALQQLAGLFNTVITSGLVLPAESSDSVNDLILAIVKERILSATGGTITNAGSFSIVVEEIHQTHLSTAEISANPEYTNTNVYNSLSDPFNDFGNNKWGLYPTSIPISLPFDLYFTEANMLLEKMGVQRYNLINTFQKQHNTFINNAAIAYMGLSSGDADIIFNAGILVSGQTGADPQIKFWGLLLAGNAQVNVDTFLQASGLDFEQLQILLTLSFINPLGDSAIVYNNPGSSTTIYDACNTANMLLTGMSSLKFDHINRFLRLWNKLNLLTTISMQELDNCISCAVLGEGRIDAQFAEHLYCFLQLMNQLGLSATQVLALYQDIDPAGSNSLYQQLFQNRQISNPLVAAFNLPLNTDSFITDTQVNPGAVAVILRACKITQEDFTYLMNFKNQAYPDLTLLTLTNLTFIYACGLLSNALSISVSDLFIFTNLVGLNPFHQIIDGISANYHPPITTTIPKATPADTLSFIAKYNEIKQAGFVVDDLNYILRNQSNAIPSLISDASAVAGGLKNIRTALQAAVAASSVAPDPQGTLLKKWLADPDLNWDKNIAAHLLSILASTMDSAYLSQVQNNLRFLQLLQSNYGASSNTVYLDKLPSIAFPDATISGIEYDNSSYYLFFQGTMSSVENAYLNALSGANAAVTELYNQSQSCPVSAVLIGPSIPTWISTNINAIQQNVPGFSCGQGALGFTGKMTGAVYNSLLAQSDDSGYGCALSQLFVMTQIPGTSETRFVQLDALPFITFPDTNATSLTYTNGQLNFSGLMSPTDCLALLGLSDDSNYQTAICSLFTASAAGQTVSAPLANLPAGWTVLPDITGIDGLSFVTGTAGQLPALCLKAPFGMAVTNALANLSKLSNTMGIQDLLGIVQPPAPITSAVPIPVLPAGSVFPPSGISFPVSAIPNVNFIAASGNSPAQITYQGVMSVYVLDLLLALSTDSIWVSVINALYQVSQGNVFSIVALPQPADLVNTTQFSSYQVTYAAPNTTDTTPRMKLSFTGQMQASVKETLLGFSSDLTYQAAIQSLFNQTSAIFGASLPTINMPDNSLATITYTPGYILFNGTPDADCNDAFNLQQLNPDPAYVNAVSFIYTPQLPPGTIGAILPSLPVITLPTATISISWKEGLLCFKGQMQSSEKDVLATLSDDVAYQNAINLLFKNSQITAVVSIPATSGGAFPDSISISELNTNGITVQPFGSDYILSFTGQMSTAQKNTLIALSNITGNDTYTNAIQNLYTQSQTIVLTTVPLASLPGIAIPQAAVSAGWKYDSVNKILSYQGAFSNLATSISDFDNLANSDPDFIAVINLFRNITANPGNNIMVFAPPPLVSFAKSNITLSNSGAISYQGGTLNYTGAMSFSNYLALSSLGAVNTGYQNAVSNIYLKSQGIANTGTIISETDAFSLPAITFPAMYANQLSFSETTSSLILKGYFDLADQSALLSFGTSSSYQYAFNELYDNVRSEIRSSGDADNSFQELYESLLIENGVLSAIAVPDRYAYFLNQISPNYQLFKQTDALVAQVAANFSISPAVSTVLVNNLSWTDANNSSSTESLLADFIAPSFVGNVKAINPDPDQFPLAKWYLILERISFLISSFNISAGDMDWLLNNGQAINTMDFSVYPDSAGASLKFSQWEVLNNLFVFQQQYKPLMIADVANPGQYTSLSVLSIISEVLLIQEAIADNITATCNPGDVLGKLQLLTGWNAGELLYLLNIGQPDLPNAILNPLQLADLGIAGIGCIPDLSDISILLTLSACFTLAGQLKVVPSRCVTWATSPLTDTIAVNIKQALKTLYPDDASWMSTIQPIMNTLRQKRRDALLAYLLSNTVQNPFGTFDVFPDESHVYGNFLIDIEMGACQPTTRIIQAYCSVQLFVQRCLMSLEPNIIVDPTDTDWQQWSWMGTFETWYEARYTFLYPENFIIPESLPNQSSFFEDMQSDLTQGAVTKDIVETAFGNYLEKLDEVARLEVKGMWYDEPTKTLHVFARNYGGDPSVYFYRTLNQYNQWSAWEQVTADVSGNQIIPLVQNGRIYLYWPVFTQTSDDDKKPQPQTATTTNNHTTTATAPLPNKYWKIQLAFSEYKNGKWTGKKISNDFLVSQKINTILASNIIFPDTSNFTFIALEVPQLASNPSDPYKDTINNLRFGYNNTIVINCLQSIPNENAQIIIVFCCEIAGGDTAPVYNTSTACYSIPIDPSLLSFKITLLNQQIDVNSIAGRPEGELSFDPTVGSNLPPIDLTQDITNVQNLIKTQLDQVFNQNLNAPYGVSFIITVQNVTLNFLENTSNENLVSINKNDSNKLDSFLLDPTRGFATTIDLGTYLSNNINPNISSTSWFNNTINHLWFNNTSMINMLASGTGSLQPTENETGLSSPPHILWSTSGNFNNLLSFQMSFWAKYWFLANMYDSNPIGGNPPIDFSLLGMSMPLFYQDSKCTFFVRQATLNNTTQEYNYYSDLEDQFIQIGDNNSSLNSQFESAKSNFSMDNGPYFHFGNFYHPFAHQFIKIFTQMNIESVLPRSIQLTGDPNPNYANSTEVQNNWIINGNTAYTDFNFNNIYNPTGRVIQDLSPAPSFPIEQIDFGLASSYGQYNWELFFHGVLMSAIRLSQNQQFQDADTWFKFIFNPTDTSANLAPQKYWVTKPFFEFTSPDASSIDYILTPDASQTFWDAVHVWRNNPYDPHAIAQLRTTPYMLAAFMKYLDNLIAWANYNYQQYTMESVNIAIQLFMTALECLGTKPAAIPPIADTPVLNYYQMELDLELLDVIDNTNGTSDPVVQFENLLPPASSNPPSAGNSQTLPTLSGLYFCIPPNPMLLAYWDTIETQLNKIRNCMNINGQFQPLSPFPFAAGINNADDNGLNDFGGVLPNYRFSTMIQKSTELCNEVKSLGAALLSALEKQDGEALALLRSSQEIAVQKSIDLVKQMQITDAELGLENLQNYQNLLNDKIAYYTDLIQTNLLDLEQKALTLNQFSLSLEGPIAAGTILAGLLRQIPNETIGINGTFGSPSITATIGGTSLGEAVDCIVQFLSFQSHFADKSASIANTNAGYARRMAEWNFQLTLANDELIQVNTQIQGAQNKIAIAAQEEQNQQLLIQNAEKVDSFLRNKYTNQQLYSWMITQLSNVYFQSYQLAYSVARQAEICFRYELGITDTSYINYGYWDSLHKGLLSGESLMSNIKQMEMDYLNLNVREYELTRQISLAQFDSVALLQLKSKGSCFITIPEELFDLDYPGHYFRRIKHIAVTIPGVVGPYTPVCLKMTLISNSVRINNTAGTAGNYPRNTDSKGAPTNDNRFLDNVAATQYIATSNGMNDGGLFEMNLHDERYLPFERAGAISTWQLEFPSVYPQFDRETISDLIIHFSYTSRDGGTDLQGVAITSIKDKLKNTMTSPGMALMQGFSAKRDFPTQWYKFLNPSNPADAQQLLMDITQRFPFFTNGLTVKISQVVLVADIPVGSSGSALANLTLSGQKLSNALINFEPNADSDTTLYSSLFCRDTVGVWTIANGAGTPAIPITAADINDIAVVFYYSVVKNNT